MPAATRPAAPSHDRYDAVVIGSGPNGLSAAIALAERGRSVLVVERAPTVGGGMRSAERTLPGFVHDVCSAIHPMAVSSPAFRRMPLDRFGLRWIHPDVPCAHPLDDGTAVLLHRSLEETAAELGRPYQRLVGDLVERADALLPDVLAPLGIPRHPLLMAAFGLRAAWPATVTGHHRLGGGRAGALFAGMAAHSVQPLEHLLTSAVGLMLCVTGHTSGWPVAAGGSQSIADALAGYLESLGGEIVCSHPVADLAELPAHEVVVADVAPPALASIAGRRLPEGFRRALGRYRFGPASFKVDWALSEPIPWKAADCARAGTVHVGGTLEEVADSERAAWEGRVHDRPFVLVAQQSLFDPARAPAGRHTGWAYCHVPSGCPVDVTDRIEAQIERFAPGFRDCILARATTSPADFETSNPNYVGGDVVGGVQDLRQLFTRPTVRLDPYSTPDPAIFLCSASTPPGGGVHGMAGHHAAASVCRRRPGWSTGAASVVPARPS